MKFDVVVGNPPYQQETKGDNSSWATPVYNYFYDISFDIASKFCLISPARFLFNAGATPKCWNEKMLEEKTIKVENGFGIQGREGNERKIKYISQKYVKDNGNLYMYKVLVPKANGTGAIGEILSTPLIGYTDTYISFGSFDNREEAESLSKYIKSKFARTMLGIKKVTQDNKSKEVWKYVPLQDFTKDSDIDWSKSIPEIDQQLYKKYGLSEEEINFIETKVKAME